MAVSQKQITLEQFLALPEVKPAREFWYGAVKRKVSPKFRHGWLQYVLADRLNQAGESKRLGIAAPETRCTFGGMSVVPDVVFFTRNRLPLDAAGELADDVFLAPDIAIEVLSPGQSVSRSIERCQWYVENDVRIALLVSPRTRTVRAFRRVVDVVVLRGSDRIDLGEMLPNFRLTVDELFGSLRLQ